MSANHKVLCGSILATCLVVCIFAAFSSCLPGLQMCQDYSHATKTLPVKLPVWKSALEGQAKQRKLKPQHIRISPQNNHSCTLSSNPLQKAHTRVVIFVPSPLPWVDRRLMVTNTFIKQGWNACDAHIVYVLGTRGGEDLGQMLDMGALAEEKARYKDISNLHFFFSDCRDQGDEWDNPNGTSATTCKTYQGFKFAARHFNAEYVWRGADDAYLNLKFFFETVAPSLPSSSLYLGHVRNPAMEWNPADMKLSRQPSLKEHVWKADTFGAYMLGMGFLVTMDVAQFIDSWKIQPHLTWCEDVMVGAWLMPFQIQWVNANDYGWSMYNREDYSNEERCSHQLLVHYVQKEDWGSIDAETGNMLFCSSI
jgi:hypothetical protein